MTGDALDELLLPPLDTDDPPPDTDDPPLDTDDPLLEPPLTLELPPDAVLVSAAAFR